MAAETEKVQAVVKATRDIADLIVELENVCEPSMKTMVRVVRARNLLADVLWDMVGSDS